jgi:hypothetical protein
MLLEPELHGAVAAFEPSDKFASGGAPWDSIRQILNALPSRICRGVGYVSRGTWKAELIHLLPAERK